MISAIVLCAGESRRMGTQKVALPWGEGTVIEHIVGVLAEGGADEILAVTGHRSEVVDALLKGMSAKNLAAKITPATVVFNSGYQSGMLSSVRCGLLAASPKSRGFLIALGDQPSISSEVVAALISEFNSDDANRDAILVPTYNGERGHPLLFGSCFRDDVLTRFDDSGLRGLLMAFPERIREVPWKHSAILRSMNYPKDYEFELGAQRDNDLK